MHKSDRPVRMANSSATVTVRTWPSPCPAKARRLSRRYRSFRYKIMEAYFTPPNISCSTCGLVKWLVTNIADLLNPCN